MMIMKALAVSAIMAVASANDAPAAGGCNFFGMTIRNMEWALMKDSVNCQCNNGRLRSGKCTAPVPAGTMPKGCANGLGHMEWGSCEDASVCDRQQCWNGMYIKQTFDCLTPSGRSIPHLSSTVVGENFCRCDGIAAPADLESECTPLAVIAYSRINPDPMYEAFDDQDYKMRVELRNDAALESDYQETQRTTANSVQGRNSQSWGGAAAGGMATSYFQVPPCSFNPPHVHPRGTEVLTVFEGSIVTQMSFLNGGKIVRTHLQPNEATIFLPGLPHFQVNVGCSTARYLSILNDPEPGVLTITATELDVTYAGVNGAPIDRQPAFNTLALVEQCFIDCGIARPAAAIA